MPGAREQGTRQIIFFSCLLLPQKTFSTWPTQTWLRIRYPVTRNASVRFLRLRHPVTRDATRRGPREVATCEGDCARRSRRPPRSGLAQISPWSRPAFHSRTRIGHRRTASRADPRRRGDFDGVCSRRVRSLDPRRRTAGTRLKQSGGPRQSARRQAPAGSGHGPWRSRPVPRPASPIGISEFDFFFSQMAIALWFRDLILSQICSQMAMALWFRDLILSQICDSMRLSQELNKFVDMFLES